MEKPLGLIIEDVKRDIINIINNANLHPCICDSIMKDLYNEIHILTMQQSQKEIEAYNMKLKKQEENKGKETENK